MRKPHLIANWKMNLPGAGAGHFVRDLDARTPDSIEVVVAPPFPFIADVNRASAALRNRVGVGAQNCSDRPSGAFTGEVSVAMLREVGAEYVIIGHSERRAIFGERDEVIGRKLAAARAGGLMPIFCIGEDEATYDRGGTIELLERQIRGAFEAAGALDSLIVAYEPVWAIGTGKNATPDIVARVHGAIRKILSTLAPQLDPPLLYGGSVAPSNADELARVGDVDGFLVGGASLDATKFLAIHASLLQAMVAI
jgi:triosephosphate isomerase (TIM)